MDLSLNNVFRKAIFCKINLQATPFKGEIPVFFC